MVYTKCPNIYNVKTKLNATHMANHVSANNVNNIIGENYDETENGTDKSCQKFSKKPQ